MSFGLNNILKKILPKGLFYRSLIIVAAPTIILQIIITIVFFDSIWIKANKGLTKSLVGEIKTLSDIYTGKDIEQIDYLTEQFKLNFDFIINVKDEKLPTVSKERKYSPMDRSLRRELKVCSELLTTGLTQWLTMMLLKLKLTLTIKLFKFYFLKKKLLLHL